MGVASRIDPAAPVRGELERVNAELSRDLQPQAKELEPLVSLAAQYRGKQLRPKLVLLCGRAVGGLCEAHVTIAKVVELIHTATLVHDDILDGATLRRRLPTVNAMHGNEATVLLGDYIYARAFHLSVMLEDQTCSRVLANVTRTICQGEITQILHRHDFDWTEARYFDVIRDKTASLYAAGCALGAHYAGGTRAQLEACERFGLELGIAFQIVDDCLDLEGDEGVVGKTLGSDLDKGKLTLPLLYLLHNGSAAALRSLMTSPGAGKLARLRAEFDLQPAVDYSMGQAATRIARASEALRALPPGAARDGLAALAQFVLSRHM